MYICFICGTSVHSIEKFRCHLNLHNNLGELIYPLKCSQNNCCSTFQNVFNLIRHVKKYHFTSSNSSDCQSESLSVPDEAISDIDVIGKDPNNDSFYARSTTDCTKEVKDECTVLVASLRAKSNVPYNVIPEIVSSINQIGNTVVTGFENEASACLERAHVDEKVFDDVRAGLKRHAEAVSEPLAFLSTRYQQDRFFDNHPLAVKPETVTFGMRMETKNRKTSLVYDTFEYVSIENTLRTLLVRQEYVEALLSYNCCPGIYQDYRDGRSCKDHFLFGDQSKFTIMIQIFYDDMGTTNPLHGNSTLHNVGSFLLYNKKLAICI